LYRACNWLDIVLSVSIQYLFYLRCTLCIKWYQSVRNDDVRRLTKQPKLTAIIQSRRLTLFGHIMHMDDNAYAKRILLASAPADWRRQLGHVAQHHPTGSETTPPYTPRSSRFGSEPPSVEDDVDVWRYAIVSCMPETTTMYTLSGPKPILAIARHTIMRKASSQIMPAYPTLAELWTLPGACRATQTLHLNDFITSQPSYQHHCFQISQWSQIIDDTVEPSCLSQKLIPKHMPVIILTKIICQDWELNPGPKSYSIPLPFLFNEGQSPVG